MVGNISQRIPRPRAVGRSAFGNNPLGYLFIAPALILYLVFNVWTIFRGITMAFTDYKFVFPDTRWDFNGITNFAEMVSDPEFWHSVWVSVKYGLMVMPTTIVVALLIAVAISRVRRGAGFYRWMVYLPVVLPTAVTFLLFGQAYNNQFGLINTVLQGWGAQSPPNWLGDGKWVLPALAAADVWRSFGFPVLLFLIGLYNIPAELYEAAQIDGASGWQQLRRITLPLLRPIIALVLILNVHLPQATDPPLILTQGGPGNASETIGFYIYRTAFMVGNLRLGYSAAMSLVVGLASAIMALAVFRMLRARE